MVTLWVLFDEGGYPRAAGHSEGEAWGQFFDVVPHGLSMDEARRAYGAIGFRCRECHLMPLDA
jgi:hypothetical protein